jgi:O-methyltransferase
MQSIKMLFRRVLPGRIYRLLLRLFRLPQSIIYFQGPATYKEDGMIVRRNADFLKDPTFVQAYQLGQATGSWQNFKVYWRLHVILWAAKHASQLEGDFIECGVFRGGYSRAIIDYIDFAKLPKKFYLMDTYEGLVSDYITDDEKALGIDLIQYNPSYEDVKKTFAPFANVVIIKGAIPETLEQAQTDKVAYLSIDMNNVLPEIAAIEYFWDKLVQGGIVVLDDYGFTSHLQQKLAFDEFAKRVGVLILTLPTGQGLILKP